MEQQTKNVRRERISIAELGDPKGADNRTLRSQRNERTNANLAMQGKNSSKGKITLLTIKAPKNGIAGLL